MRSAGRCRAVVARRRRSPCRRSRAMRSSRSNRTARRCRPRWPSCASSGGCCATRRWDRASYPSSPMRHAPSVWRACSARSASTPPWGSSINPRTPAPCSPTAKRRMVNCSRRASPRQARCPRGWRRRRPTACTVCRSCRSTSTTRSSASSASAISSGRPPTSVRADSCWAPRPGAPRSRARGCSTRTARAISSPRPSPIAVPTIRRSRASLR